MSTAVLSGASAELARIFAEVPSMNCKGRCQECCGPIGIYPAEAAHIRAHTGRWELPVVTGDDLTCSALTPQGRCSIYEARPLICRVWGAVKSMRCPHGCRPSRWLSDREAHALIDRVEALASGPVYYTSQSAVDAILAARVIVGGVPAGRKL